MRPFGTSGHSFNLDDPDPDHAAEWLLNIVDESPDRLAIITIPPHRDDDDLDYLEGRFIAAYDIAKNRRPNLSVKALHAMDGSNRSRIVVAVHEHEWVGGQCVRGCPDIRDVDRGDRAA
jgi:hypothetical protein